MDLINLKVDGKPISVPKGTNLIEAARIANTEIPHYCYHPHLSIVGNCRMCQIEVVGAPKLMIGCHTMATEGMEVKTHLTSPQVKEAQAATLEFILINHPLDCTVCDQSGHCKLQDYHFEYNAQDSRFIEKKEEKVKAEVLGPNVILDGERCIMCTRCIRFCDEVTKTSELGMLNRGDRSVISINPGKELDNALSGTVVDLCPVGALTHRKWRFNTRIWYTKQVDAICPGCSTGCNVKLASRDNKIVHVKARLNSDVNKEWLCDEGRYGFDRFLPANRIKLHADKVEAGLKLLNSCKGKKTVVFLSPSLTLEDYFSIQNYLKSFAYDAKVVLAYTSRKLDRVESILVSPNKAANYVGAKFAGLVDGDLEAEFNKALDELSTYQVGIFIGDFSLSENVNVKLFSDIANLEYSIGFLSDADSEIASAVKTLIPVRTILEKSGILINRDSRAQYSERAVDFSNDTHPEWRLFNQALKLAGIKSFEGISDRDQTINLMHTVPQFDGHSIKDLKKNGLVLS